MERLKLFDAIITSVACFAPEHRPIYADDLRKLDIEFRRLLRQVVGPPPDTDWTALWHETLHEWNHPSKLVYRQLGLFKTPTGSCKPPCRLV